VHAEPRILRFAGIGDEAAPEPARQIEAHRRLGWDVIELRSAGGVPLAELDEATFGRLAAAVGAAGLDVVCVDSRIGNYDRPVSADFALDVAELTTLLPRCAAVGAGYIRIMSYPGDGRPEAGWAREVKRRIGELTRRAADAGLTLLHENCAGWAGTDAARMRELVGEVDSPALRLLFDIGNGAAYGYQAYDVLRDVVDLVAHVHVKDAVGTGENTRYTPPGDGDCRVADCLRLLFRHGYQGVLAIEPHLSVRPERHRMDAGADGLAEFVAYGRQLEQLATEVLREQTWTV
jgi:sugar phosphate isomerase/epimerase